VHVGEVRGCRPVDGFGAEFYRRVCCEQVRGVPGAVDGPLLDGISEDKGFVRPVGGVGFWGEIGKAGDRVGGGDVGGKGGKRRVGALKGPVENVGEEVVAWNGGGVLSGDVEIGRAPGPAPREVCGWRARRMLAI
jgi:hypothetical protein